MHQMIPDGWQLTWQPCADADCETEVCLPTSVPFFRSSTLDYRFNIFDCHYTSVMGFWVVSHLSDTQEEKKKNHAIEIEHT